MQFKLLQIYKTMSNFSISLIMEFIPFLILGFALPTMGLARAIGYMFAYWALQNLFIVCINLSLKKVFFKKPQIFLLLRIIPIVCCEICILFLNANAIWLIIITAFFSAAENCFNDVPIDIIYNYVSEGADEKTLGLTRFLEQMGWFVAGIVGGLFLDHIPQFIVVIFSLTIFIGSAVPMFVFYFKFKSTPNFNEDFVSYLVAREEGSQAVKKLQKSFLIKHYLTYFFTGPAFYGFYYLVTAIIYIETDSFFLAGVANSVYDGIYGISCLVVGKLLTRVDGKNYASIVILYLTVGVIVSYFVRNLYLICGLYWLGAFIHPFLNLHLYQSYLDKARILGVGNEMLVNQCNAQWICYAVCYGSGVFGLLAAVICASTIAMTGLFVARHYEDSTTKDLVNYLNLNDTQ